MRRILYALALVLLLATPTSAQQQVGQLQTCQVINTSTATLVAFVGAGCVGRETQVAFFITDIVASASVVATTTADQQLTLKYGTGTNCGTGTVVLWSAYNLAFDPVAVNLTTPLKVPGGQDLCWMHAATGSKTFIVRGYLGPQ